MTTFLKSLAIAGALAAGACGTTSGTVEYSGGYAVDTPDLVYVSPGVSVIADYDEPIFYSDGYYWRNDGGAWYRSGYYTGGWVSASAPYAVVSIGSPYRYRHYRPTGYVASRGYYSGNRGYYGGNRGYYQRPAVRDHRSYTPPPSRGGGFRAGGGYRGGGRMTVRDHRH